MVGTRNFAAYAAERSLAADGFIVDSANINAQTGASYTLVAGDNGRTITMNNGSANTLTVPAGLAIGFACAVIQIGAGQTTLSASGATLNSYGGQLRITGQHGAAAIFSYATNVFNVAGNLSA